MSSNNSVADKRSRMKRKSGDLDSSDEEENETTNKARKTHSAGTNI
jgi:thiamine pyrophosphokinase